MKMKKVSREPNQFERLVSMTEERTKKRQAKTREFGAKTEEPGLKRLRDKFSNASKLLEKREKKNLFDLESSDDEVFEGGFAADGVEELKGAGAEALSGQPAKKKTKREVFSEVIAKSRAARMSKADRKEAMIEEIGEMNTEWAGVSKKLKGAEKDRGEKTDEFARLVSSFSTAPLMKAVVAVKPKVERCDEEEANIEESDGSEVGELVDEAEEEEIKDRRWVSKGQSDGKIKGILKNFNRAIEQCKEDQSDSEENEEDDDEDDLDLDPNNDDEDEDDEDDEDEDEDEDEYDEDD